ncbi:MAG: hypothetical protein HC901_01970 [Bdellovibrionaceae bacterium]|nr:hypothetical protein [Pseudobdellovibrionaceae bacterium]
MEALAGVAGVAGDPQRLIEEELFKVRKEIKERELRLKNEREARLAGVREGLQEIQGTPYVPGRDYPEEQVEAMARRIEALLVPGAEIRGEIESTLRPWKTHLDRVKEGKVWRNGEWLNQEDYRVRREHDARDAREAYLANLRPALPQEVMPDNQARMTVGLVGAGLLTSILLLLMLVRDSFHGSLSHLQVAVLVALLVMLGAYGYLIFAVMAGPKDLASWQGAMVTENFQEADSPLGWALARAGGVYDKEVAPGPKLTLRDGDINAYLAQLGGAGGAESIWKSEALAVVFSPTRVNLVQLTRLWGRPVLLEFDLQHAQEDQTTVFKDLRFRLGTLRMPSTLGAYLFKFTGTQMFKLVAATKLLEHYRVAEIGEGEAVVIHKDDLVHMIEPAGTEGAAGKEEAAGKEGEAGTEGSESAAGTEETKGSEGEGEGTGGSEEADSASGESTGSEMAEDSGQDGTDTTGDADVSGE